MSKMSVQHRTIRMVQNDCVAFMRDQSEGSIGAIVCDPPYLIGFMGKEFDEQDGAHQDSSKMGEWHAAWLAEAYRVLRSGGAIKAFSATRTFHRLAQAMVQVGFKDIRIEAWVHGQGFPKSLNVGKALDKIAGADAGTDTAIQDYIRTQREHLGLSKGQVDQDVFGGTTRYTWVEGRGGDRSDETYLPTPDEWGKLKAVLQLDDRYDDYIQKVIPCRENRARADGGKAIQVGSEVGDWGYQQDGERWEGTRKITSPATEEATMYAGYGTALKPSFEPFVVGTKP